MKKIYLKEYNALFDYPIVKKPKHMGWKTPTRMRKDKEAYNKWLSSKIEIVGEHSWQDLQVVVEGVDYRIAHAGNGNATQNAIVANPVAIPIKSDKDYVPSVPSNDETSVASHSSTFGKYIEQLVTFINELKSEAMINYTKAENEEAKTMYSTENMICGMILSKIKELNTKS